MITCTNRQKPPDCLPHSINHLRIQRAHNDRHLHLVVVGLGHPKFTRETSTTGGWSPIRAASQYFRNAIVHADSRKLTTIPGAASSLPESVQDSIWARQKGGNWSLQMPHAVTAVRTTVAVFNTVADTLYASAGLDESAQAVLRTPDEVVPFGD